MISDWKVYGHAPAKEVLGRQLKSGRLAHAYLFAGPEGLGKKMLALELAQKILGTDKLARHPDFQLLEGAGEIGMEQARDFMATLSVKPFFGAKKIAIIDNAHLLNSSGGNAILKTLEEPSESTVLILVSASANLLPTIVSRCQVLAFNSFSRHQLEDFAKQASLSPSTDELALAFGRPGRLVRLCADEDFFAQEFSRTKTIADLQNMPLAERLLIAGEFSELESGELTELIKTWTLWKAQELMQKPSGYKLLQCLCESAEDAASNKNKKLILQSIATQM